MKTQQFGSSHHDIEQATQILADGGLVAIPTETVYGLGADALSDQAVAKIYEAKGRPSFNPLISHMASPVMVRDYVEWSGAAERLSNAFWPGPMTLILPAKQDCAISQLARAGLPSVAIRVPAHPVAQTLLSKLDRPVAAPSANPSGKISPTTMDHVIAGLDGRIDAVVDGGACEMGVESTIISLLDDPIILRPGNITIEEIQTVLGTGIKTLTDVDTITAPGQLTSHYAPNASVRLNATEFGADEKSLGFGKIKGDVNLSPTANLREATANLFSMLHELDARAGSKIAVAPIPNHGLGIAINDRLTRAAAPRS
jgi:L-threonylcarbamoyladenylate synthase